MGLCSFKVVLCYLVSLVLYIYCLIFLKCPPGMKQQVLQFFTNLLGKVKTPLLPHVNVHKPVHVSNIINGKFSIL